MNFRALGFRFRVDEKHFESGAFRKRQRRDNQVNSQTGKCCVLLISPA